MNTYQPYTYLIGWTDLNLWYYGVRYANKTFPEDDFWHAYFTSSKSVKILREEYGDPDVIQIRKRFDSVIKAKTWEKNVLSKLGVVRDVKWLNQSVPGVWDLTDEIVDKIRQTISQKRWITDGSKTRYVNNAAVLPDGWYYGRSQMTAAWRKKLSDANIGNKASAETRAKLSAARRQENNNFWNGPHSGGTKEKMSTWYKENSHPSSNGSYLTPWGEFRGSSSAAKAAPFNINSGTVWRYCIHWQDKIITPKSIIGKNIPSLIGISYETAGFGMVS